MSDNNAKEQAIAQANSVAAMVAALNVDYDRLEELRDELADLTKTPRLRAEQEWRKENGNELAQLEADAGECKDADQARERIQEDALDVQYRSTWQSVGEELKAYEFSILLCTGGPAVRIIGELNEHMEPYRTWIEYQDWGTSWMMLDSTHYSQDTLLEYCQCFYFGE